MIGNFMAKGRCQRAGGREAVQERACESLTSSCAAACAASSARPRRQRVAHFIPPIGEVNVALNRNLRRWFHEALYRFR